MKRDTTIDRLLFAASAAALLLTSLGLAAAMLHWIQDIIHGVDLLR